MWFTVGGFPLDVTSPLNLVVIPLTGLLTTRSPPTWYKFSLRGVRITSPEFKGVQVVSGNVKLLISCCLH